MAEFTQKESKEMYDALVEIQEALTTLRENEGGVLGMRQYEIGWLTGIDELLKKINETGH